MKNHSPEPREQDLNGPKLAAQIPQWIDAEIKNIDSTPVRRLGADINLKDLGENKPKIIRIGTENSEAATKYWDGKSDRAYDMGLGPHEERWFKRLFYKHAASRFGVKPADGLPLKVAELGIGKDSAFVSVIHDLAPENRKIAFALDLAESKVKKNDIPIETAIIANANDLAAKKMPLFPLRQDGSHFGNGVDVIAARSFAGYLQKPADVLKLVKDALKPNGDGVAIFSYHKEVVTGKKEQSAGVETWMKKTLDERTDYLTEEARKAGLEVAEVLKEVADVYDPFLWDRDWAALKSGKVHWRDMAKPSYFKGWRNGWVNENGQKAPPKDIWDEKLGRFREFGTEAIQYHSVVLRTPKID